MKAPVVEAMISTEEEEKIKDELFSRPSPTPEEEVKIGEGTPSPALSPIHSPVQRLHNQDSLAHPEREQEENSLEQTKDKTTSSNIQQGTLPCTEEDEMAEGDVSKPPLEEPSGGDDGVKDVPLNSVDSKSDVEESDDIFQCSMGEEKEVTEAGDKGEREVIEVEQTGENQNMEITEDDLVEEEPKNMVKLVFKEKRDSNEETEVTAGQPQNDAFRLGFCYNPPIIANVRIESTHMICA